MYVYVYIVIEMDEIHFIHRDGYSSCKKMNVIRFKESSLLLACMMSATSIRHTFINSTLPNELIMRPFHFCLLRTGCKGIKNFDAEKLTDFFAKQQNYESFQILFSLSSWRFHTSCLSRFVGCHNL